MLESDIKINKESVKSNIGKSEHIKGVKGDNFEITKGKSVDKGSTSVEEYISDDNEFTVVPGIGRGCGRGRGRGRGLIGVRNMIGNENTNVSSSVIPVLSSAPLPKKKVGLISNSMFGRFLAIRSIRNALELRGDRLRVYRGKTVEQMLQLKEDWKIDDCDVVI